MTQSGKTAIVTGGLSGMGLAIARRLARDGIDVTIGTRRGGDAQLAGDLLRAHDLNAQVAALDVCDGASVAGFVADVVARRGGVDILVNAAGVYEEAAVIDHPDAVWDSQIDTNLSGTFRMIRAEGAPHGITCVSISPTWVETEMLKQFIDADIASTGKSREEVRAEYEASNPQHQLVQPDEIAELAAFLVSDAARAITMEDFQVNAGSLW